MSGNWSWTGPPSSFPRRGYLLYRLLIGLVGLSLNGLVIRISFASRIRSTTYRPFVLAMALLRFCGELFKLLFRLLLFSRADFAGLEAAVCLFGRFVSRVFSVASLLAVHPLLLQRYVAVCRPPASWAHRVGLGLQTKRSKGVILCLILLIGIGLASRTLLQTYEGRVYGGLGCSLTLENGTLEEKAFGAVQGLSVVLNLVHFALLSFYSVSVLLVVRGKKVALRKTSKEARRLRETEFVMRAGIVQAMAAILLFLPLFGVLLSGLSESSEHFLYVALELFQLGPVYEGTAALVVLAPYRKWLLGRLGRGGGVDSVIEEPTLPQRKPSIAWPEASKHNAGLGLL